ncbi:MobP2 family relaxase [Heyndrickxia ginsengihumi]|uniref:MobP2 family relaxase n=1 Tax=Heyndrickxia ginsengihumi TaxID=363870 RepID=UPI0004715BEF|nr:MobP2 family relaxase [Heyndrickxia ginsengihumi]
MPSVTFMMAYESFSKEDVNFQGYIEYMDRKEASQEKNNFSNYQEYMDNQAKTNSLFNMEKDELSKNDKDWVKQKFDQAQDNSSVLWKDVISFDNDWLEKHGVLDSKTQILDDKKLKDITRQAVKKMWDIQGKDLDDIVWIGAIHYNTDNIHIHLASVEINPSQMVTKSEEHYGEHRGVRKKEIADAVKSTFINEIAREERNKLNERLDNILRERIIKKKKETPLTNKRKIKKLTEEILKELESVDKPWRYSDTKMTNIRPKLDELTTLYLKTYHKKDLKELDKVFEDEKEFLIENYGEGDKDGGKANERKKNKIQDLYKRLGNAILKEMREMDKLNKKIEHKARRAYLRKRDRFSYYVKRNYEFDRILRKAKRNLDDNYDNWKNQKEYEEMQNDIENQR